MDELVEKMARSALSVFDGIADIVAPRKIDPAQYEGSVAEAWRDVGDAMREAHKAMLEAGEVK